MSNYAISLKRTTLLLLALAFTAVLTIANLSIFGVGHASADQLTNRSLSMASSLNGLQTTGAANTTETNGSATEHTFVFTMPSAQNVEAVLFKYCTTAIGACNSAGLNMSAQSSTLHSEDFSTVFANDTSGLETEDAECLGANGRNNCVGIFQDTGASESGTKTVVFRNIKNPETNGTFFVRIRLYQAYTTDDYSSPGHDGTVASATTTGIAITSKVVETLGFSTTAQINTTNIPAEGASCTALSGTGTIALGDAQGALSITTPYDAYSAFRLYTNSANGTDVQYEGSTLTKGSDNINAIGTNQASAIGTEQFGLAVDLTADSANANLANVDTTEGGAGQLDIIGDYDGGHGTIASGFFSFAADTKTTIASSTQHVTCDTYAVQYVANIHPTTPAGTYTTTIVWFAVPEY